MKKKIIVLALAGALLLGLSGCYGMFKKEYSSVSKYTDQGQGDESLPVKDIADYNQLKYAISSMVTSHTDEERLSFTKYEGDVQNDLDQACWEVREDTPLGSYAVDYMSCYPNKILNYYEATVYITYKRSQAEIRNIEYVHGIMELTESLGEVLQEMGDKAVYSMTSETLTEDMVKAAVDRAFGSNPLSCVYSPTVEVDVHPDVGVSRIVELDFKYDESKTKLEKTKKELSETIDSIYKVISSDDPATYALRGFNHLASYCRYDPEGTLRDEIAELDKDGGATLYGALQERFADSKGIALAYSALCRKNAIESMVVSGTYDKAEHFWNLIKIDGSWYHVDVSKGLEMGSVNAFMRYDEQMQSRYWWNIESYPESSAS